MIFISRWKLERLIDDRVSKAINEYHLNGGGRMKEYTITTVYSDKAASTFIEESGRPPYRGLSYLMFPRESLPPMSLTQLLNRIVEAAGIKLSIEPSVPAQLKAECKKWAK